MTEELNAQSAELSASAQSLSAVAEVLKELVARFRLANGAAHSDGLADDGEWPSEEAGDVPGARRARPKPAVEAVSDNGHGHGW